MSVMDFGAFVQVMPGQIAGKSEVTSDGLANLVAIQRTSQWIGNTIGNRPVVLVALVERRDVVKAFLHDGPKEQFDPFGCDAAKV